MRERDEGIDNKEVLAQEVCAMKEQQQGLPKAEGEPAGINPWVDSSREKEKYALTCMSEQVKERNC